ncbi:ABC transporter substrate-binding protein [Ralstonia sp. R-29]|uniref:ABC transporter substrate-binding protein n=1 Tax=Ralstonia sp. R-29 TaxID=3404059 RepID=UPI003CEC13EE
MLNLARSTTSSIFGLLLSCLCAAPAFARDRAVAVTAIVEHPALEAVRDGIKDELKAEGFESGKNFKLAYYSAQGNPATAAQIARQVAGEGADVIVGISTPSAQAAAAATKTIPVVFAAVTDPISAKLVAGEGAMGGNVTGVSDRPPVDYQVSLIKMMLPSAKRLGVIYSPGEANSVAQFALLKASAEAAGLSIVEAPAVKSSEVQTAAKSLVGRIDVLYVPADNAVVSAIDAVLSVMAKAKVPVIAPDEQAVEKGAIASIGFDFYQLGRQTGGIVAEILKGQPAGSIAWQYGSGTSLVLNARTAKLLGLDLPPAVLKRAKKILGA